MKIINHIDEAQSLLKQGKIIAYPTEAIYGLGCDPFNGEAVKKILALKLRPAHKGLIVLIADWSQLMPLINVIPEHLLDAVRASWPGPVTWLFPKASTVPDWVSGTHNSIAIRMSAHPIAQALCSAGPIISTSANISGHEPARTIAEVQAQFPHGIDVLIEGALGGADQPSAIYDVLSGQRLR
jgi:L-threonylcarbamoyladenylate synthase